MPYVLDANVVSALRIHGRHPAVEEWASTVPVADLYLTAVTVAEIERGVAARERVDPAQGGVLRRWLEERVLVTLADRVLAFDLAAARVLGRSRVPEHAPRDDALIAAISEASGMTVATRNLKHFEPLGVRCLDPWLPTKK